MTDLDQALAAQIQSRRLKIARQIAASHKSYGAIEQAITDVEAGHAERICAPGKWVVWRGENGRACLEVKA